MPTKTLLDIETAPILTTVWGLKQDGYIPHHNIERDTYIICASWKEQGKSKIYKTCVKGKWPQDDKQVAKDLHMAMGTADEVIGHNADNFDFPIIRARCLYHGLPPLPKVVQTDTKKIAKRLFRFSSNRLDYLGKHLGVGEKIKTVYSLWLDCVKGDQKALDKMLRYNVQDVKLLERVYDKLIAHAPARLNMNLFTPENGCPSCGSDQIQRRGLSYTQCGTKQRIQCLSCGHWSHEAPNTTRGIIR